MSDERIELEDDGMDYSSLLKSIKHNMDPENNTALLIDDERGIRKMVARSIKGFAPNLKIYEAANGRAGLEALAQIRKTHTREPLMIVLDLNMPVMNGWDFITEMKKEYVAAGKTLGIPIIVLSSTSGEKGALFLKKSVHNAKYSPLVTIAKETCVDKSKYNAKDEKGLEAWLKYFLEKE